MSKGLNSTPVITQERLFNYVHYEPRTGHFTWLVSSGGRLKGCRAGAKLNTGYIQLQIDRRFYTAHRLAWLYCHGSFPERGVSIDHINRIRDDNRIENLRIFTPRQQARNIDCRARNGAAKSGFVGVYKNRQGKWWSHIQIDNKPHYLGIFATKEDAARAYNEAIRKNYGEHSPDAVNQIGA